MQLPSRSAEALIELSSPSIQTSHHSSTREISQNSGRETKKEVIIGIMFVGVSTGTVIGPHLFIPSEAPHHSKGLRTNFILFIVIILLICRFTFFFRLLNGGTYP